MIPLALGGLLVLALFWAAGAFSRASIAGIKALLGWTAALAALAGAALLLLSGRGAVALSLLLVLGPLAWSTWQGSRGRRTAPPPSMTRQDAFEVLGLPPTATEAEIRAAWLRLLRAAHPDAGGSDWLAARVNQAKDILLSRR